MFVVDKDSRLLLMHRSDKVRSARNVWSIPSGEHEIGESAPVCAFRELYEEYGLSVIGLSLVDQYENIAGDKDAEEQYHWVISLFVAEVEDVSKALNKEPEKHDKMLFLPYQIMGADDFLELYPFHESLANRMRIMRFNYVESIRYLLNPDDGLNEALIMAESPHSPIIK